MNEGTETSTCYFRCNGTRIESSSGNEEPGSLNQTRALFSVEARLGILEFLHYKTFGHKEVGLCLFCRREAFWGEISVGQFRGVSGFNPRVQG